MDIRHIQKCEYIPENVRENNLKVHPRKCSQEQSQVWKFSSPDEGAVHALPEKIDEAVVRAEIFKSVQTLTKWLTVLISEKLRE